MGKRIFLFIMVNILVLVTISITLNLLQAFGVINFSMIYKQSGINYQGLLVFCAICGFAGALISLFLSKPLAKMAMGVKVIDPDHPASRDSQLLLDVVYRLCQQVGISSMPEVGIYESPEVNAFATGAGKNSALVAVSSGLLQKMNRDEIEGVLAHEVSHVASGDMVTMTLIQGIINTFVMFFARIAAWAISNFLRKDDEEVPSYFLQYLLVFLFEIILSILGSFVVAYFSRIREYSADKNAAMLAGKDKMIRALTRLKATLSSLDNAHQSVATLKINGNQSLFFRLLATHPPLEERIARLKNLTD